LRDAEAFDEVAFVLERLGVVLTGKILDLGKYQNKIQSLADRSPLAEELPRELPGWHTAFSTLYSMIRVGRNDALHQGAFARRLTEHVVDVSLVLEDALMKDAVCARDFMVSNVTCAALWEPVSSVRRAMLMNSFSYLPVPREEAGTKKWFLVSDFTLASFLRGAVGDEERKKRLALTLAAAEASKGITLTPAPQCQPEDSVAQVLSVSNGLPVVVVGPDPKCDLRGIITPFDVL
jgi:hypothetical protein